MYSVFCVTWSVWQQISMPLFPILSSDSSEDFVDNRQVWLSPSRRGLSSLQTVRQWALVREFPSSNDSPMKKNEGDEHSHLFSPTNYITSHHIYITAKQPALSTGATCRERTTCATRVSNRGHRMLVMLWQAPNRFEGRCWCQGLLMMIRCVWDNCVGSLWYRGSSCYVRIFTLLWSLYKTNKHVSPLLPLLLTPACE